jgi:hypothetical protein
VPAAGAARYCLDDDLQRHNAVKNVLATYNLVSRMVFAVKAPVSPVVVLSRPAPCRRA